MKTLFLTYVFAVVVTLPILAEEKESKPNIIIFMADDMGYADAGFTGAKDIKTPNLDELASSGVVFTSGYANHAFSAPSRAALLSGRYQHRFGFETNPAYDPSNPLLGIDPSVKLFPERLREAGYVTGGIGKWHLGAAEPFHPNNRGFDYYYGFLGGGHDYYKIDLTAPVDEAYKQGLVRNDKPADFEGYLTTALSRDAVRFVENNKENQFFLYVAYNAPHQPLQAPADDIARYAHITDKKRRVYAAMVDVMDRGIGEVVTALKECDIFENTLIFFLSDNGGPIPSELNPNKGNGSDNSPFRGGKGNVYDGGVHVPFMACWPAKIKPGVIYDFPVNSLDISRTAVAVAGANAFSDGGMEGVDLIPFVLGEIKEAPHEAIFWRGGNGSKWSILTADRTKLVNDREGDKKSDKAELFYLPSDKSETTDIIELEPEKAKSLHNLWKEWDKNNIPGRFLGYKNYHDKRDEFFKGAVAGERYEYLER